MSAPERRLPTWAGALLALPIGIIMAVQSELNGTLAADIDDGLLVALWSFGSSGVLTAAAVLLSQRSRHSAASYVRDLRHRRLPWWYVLPGVGGAFTVATQSLTVGVIGVAAFTVGLVAGSTVSGTVLDRIGYGPRGVVPLSAGRVVGAVLVIVAVAVGLLHEGHVPLWMLVFPFVGGLLIAWQQATNGRVGGATGSVAVATLSNYVFGTAALALAVAVRAIASGGPHPLPNHWWLYLGGVLGIVYVAGTAALVRVSGVLLLGLGTVVGQLTTALVIRAFWPAPDSAPMLYSLISVIVALIGTAAAVVPWRSRRTSRLSLTSRS